MTNGRLPTGPVGSLPFVVGPRCYCAKASIGGQAHTRLRSP